MPTTEGGRCSEDSSSATLTRVVIPCVICVPDLGVLKELLASFVERGIGRHLYYPGESMVYWVGPESFADMSDTDLLAWLEAVESTYGEGAAIELGQQLNLADRLEGSGLNPEYVAKVKDHISKGHARVQAKTMIQDIGISIGAAADKLVLGTLEPVLEAPHMEPDFVWAISRAYWHEIVHRGMELGRYDAMWIKGIKEFPYDEVLVFAQHIWAAFKRVTFLDFTIPHESHIIKSWLSISEKWSERETAPDVADDTIGNKEKRLQDYIDYGGPSHALTLGEGKSLDPLDSLLIEAVNYDA